MESRKPSPLPLWALALALLSFHCGSDPGSNSPSSTSPSSTSEDAPGESSSPNLLDAPADDAGAGGKLAPLDIPEDAPTVVFLGDSIGAGLVYHLSKRELEAFELAGGNRTANNPDQHPGGFEAVPMTEIDDGETKK